MEKLKPCPFCGNYPLLRQDASAPEWKVECIGYGCATLPSTWYFDTKEDAIKAWNMREQSVESVEDSLPAQPGEDIRAMCGECDAWNQYKNYPQPGWIPCSERLPEDEEEVIVSVRDDSGDNTLDYSSCGWYACAGDFWVVDNDANRNVVAWMPLPEPYK